ncbi:MAG: PIN domain-containing protein [Oscillospiraceae bacterium]|nr:PIN domain-containing protein [Oscillospiraceae bacterium]
MKDKAFVDTNLLVYSYTNSDSEKHQIAKGLFQGTDTIFVISVQVLNEFYSTLSKFKIEHDIIVSIVSEIIAFCEVKSIELQTVQTAFSLKKRYGYSYWDSLILSSALENGCKQILTEDMQNGQVIENSLKIKNIFLSG